jgi:hypothetical protein
MQLRDLQLEQCRRKEMQLSLRGGALRQQKKFGEQQWEVLCPLVDLCWATRLKQQLSGVQDL